ncbi:hypothetical protein [Streptacidiphilus albus]|uniref:hypothetical protein n=1 Tax=Streptacidiphilus albus TaxID=105425 RepID=UPI00128CF059|nr:hypothetical protein [Streptacidiphilus albus]
MITRIWNRLRRRRWTEPDTLTRLPIPGPGSNERVTFSAPIDQPHTPGADELAARANLFRLLGVGGPL